MKGFVRLVANGQQLGIVVIILGLLAGTQLVNSNALDPSNLVEVLRSTSVYFIGASAATLLLVGGGLDLSVGSVFAVGGVVAGIAMNDGIFWPMAVVLALVFCGALGLVNAALIIWVHVPPFIATLAMLFTASGAVVVVTAGTPRFNFPQGFDNMGQRSLLGIPLLVYYAVLVGVLAHVFLQHTRFGYNVRALGGNPAAARANGIRPIQMNIALYVISAVVSGLCGVLLAARVSTADPGAGGTGFTFQVIAAVIIGGTSLFGGVGTITGTALGSMLFAVINDVLALNNINPQWTDIVTGIVLALAVATDQLRRDRRFRMSRS